MSRTDLEPHSDRIFGEVVAVAPGSTSPAAPKPKVDGRHARSERSRQAMVGALLDLLREGNIRPSSAQIADRAGVTQRTLFNQFGDMDSLVSAVAARQVRRFVKILPDAGEGTLEQRVSSYCDGLERMLEETMHIRWAVATNPNQIWSGTDLVRTARLFMRNHLLEGFAPELDRLSHQVQTEVLNALELETDPVIWRLRRFHQELSQDESRAAVERAMLALLRDTIPA